MTTAQCIERVALNIARWRGLQGNETNRREAMLSWQHRSCWKQRVQWIARVAVESTVLILPLWYWGWRCQWRALNRPEAMIPYRHCRQRQQRSELNGWQTGSWYHHGDTVHEDDSAVHWMINEHKSMMPCRHCTVDKGRWAQRVEMTQIYDGMAWQLSLSVFCQKRSFSWS